MAGSGDVVCAGIIVVDHVAAPVDHFPAAGELVLTDACVLAIGGCASNVAVDLSRLDVASVLVGCVGTDSFGEFARAVLRERGVDTGGVTTCPNVATSQTLIVNVKGQDRRFIHHRGASGVFAAEHFPRDRLRAAKVLYLGGYFLTPALVPDDLAEVFADARVHGCATMLDVVTPGPDLDYEGALSRVLPQTDVFLPNTDEAAVMSGLHDPVEQAEHFLRLGAKTVVVTRGGDGVVVATAKERWRADAFPVDYVDATGGGDAFDAGFVYGLLRGAPLERCVELGSALGASCVRRIGATEGVFR
ncbi:MAG: carbohydrate kinase family protein, partial [Planctomycetia bacterium]